MRVRPLLVDGKVKEWTTGESHDITDRSFVVRRALRINDALPGDKAEHWVWQRGPWLLIDRVKGNVTALHLPDYEPTVSNVIWFRDYAAYCGLSASGKQLYAIVAQVAAHRPPLAKKLSPWSPGESPGPACAPAVWERDPLRITFQQTGGPVSYDLVGLSSVLVEDGDGNDTRHRGQPISRGFSPDSVVLGASVHLKFVVYHIWRQIARQIWGTRLLWLSDLWPQKTMLVLDELLEEAKAAHGHMCAGQILGVRMAILGCNRLGLDDPQDRDRKRLITFVEIDRCATDAIGVVTGCRLGKRALKFRDWGKMAATFSTLKTIAPSASPPASRRRSWLANDIPALRTRTGNKWPHIVS